MSDWSIQFSNESDAERALASSGFSLGRRQADAPRGIMFGDYDIQKWRNLRASDREALHGTYQRSGLGGPVSILLRSGGAPGHALRRLETATETAQTGGAA